MKKFCFVILMLSMMSGMYAQSGSNRLSGTYTISNDASQSPDYASFGAAVQSLSSSGVTGQVVFEVAAGTYEEFVTIPQINGASESNRIIFRGMGADNRQVVLTSNAGYTENNTITLDGADYIGFENMTVTTTSTSYGNLLYFKNSVTGNHFNNIRFVGIDVMASTYNNDKQLVYDKSGDWQDGDMQFVNCEFVNGYIALYMQGQGMTTPKDQNLLVENCTFTNQYSKSIYTTFQDNEIIRGNTFNNSKDLKDGFQAIDVYRAYNGSIIENNVVNIDYSNCYATGIELRPGTGTAENPIIVRNNIVTINSNVNLSYCYIISNNATDYLYFAHNTGKVTGTGAGSNLFVEDSFQNLEIYNNLFVNETSGYIFRFQSSDVTGRICDYNKVKFEGSYVGRLGSSDYASLSEWNTASGFDQHSEICNPEFISNSDLHILSSTGMTVANSLSYVTTDIDGDLRASEPCAGADEYASGTNLPPVVANPVADVIFEENPASTSINLTNTFTDPDDPDENIVIELISNSNSTIVSASINAKIISITRLVNESGTAVLTLRATSNEQTVETSFSVECRVEDQPPVVINQLEPISFNEYPQQLTFDLSNTFDDPDNNNEMMVLSVQSCPSIISASINNRMLTVSRTTPAQFLNQILIIRASSNGKYVDINVSVSGDEITLEGDIAIFEDVTLSSSGYWIPQEEGSNTMTSYSWNFTNYYSSAFWGGFTASDHADLTATGLDAQYTAVTGIGYGNSSQYAVAYTYGAQTVVSASDNTSGIISGCYVTNNLWAYQSITEGDSYSTPFGGLTGNDPDCFYIYAIGKNAAGQPIDTLFFYLADYRFEDNTQDYVVDTWEWFDLSPLGEVASISFGLESTKGNSYGFYTPAYFCMDDFNGEAPMSDLPPYVINPVDDIVFYNFPDSIQLSLDGVVTDDDNDDELIEYTILSSTNESDIAAEIIDKTLYINRLTNTNSTAILTIRATSNGLYADFQVNVMSNDCVGIDENELSAMIYPNPANEVLNIILESNIQCFEYTIYNALGQVLNSRKVMGFSASLNLEKFGTGIYFIAIQNESRKTIKKIIVE